MTRLKSHFVFTRFDCPHIAETAKSFAKIGKDIVHSWKNHNENNNLSDFGKMDLAAASVNLHFALELYLKCLNLQITNQYQGGHEISKLFQILPTQIKGDIEVLFAKKCEKLDGKLPVIRTSTPFQSKEPEYDPFRKVIPLYEFLKAHNSGYVKWRYHFELDINGSHHADFPLIMVLIECLLTKINQNANDPD